MGTAQDEWQLFVLGVALGFWSATLGVLAYLALEPVVLACGRGGILTL